MNLDKKSIYLIAGITLIVGSFFYAAKAVVGIFCIGYYLFLTDFSGASEDLSKSLLHTFLANQISTTAMGAFSFFILFFAGRWFIKGPKMIDKWLDSTETTNS